MQWNTTQSLKEWDKAICSNTDTTRDSHAKWGSQEEKDKYRVISLTYEI